MVPRVRWLGIGNKPKTSLGKPKSGCLSVISCRLVKYGHVLSTFVLVVLDLWLCTCIAYFHDIVLHVTWYARHVVCTYIYLTYKPTACPKSIPRPIATLHLLGAANIYVFVTLIIFRQKNVFFKNGVLRPLARHTKVPPSHYITSFRVVLAPSNIFLVLYLTTRP